MKTRSIMIVGVGGQGSLLASRIIGNVLLSQGFDVKVSEVHGMSQRGGSVVTYVKYGSEVCSPVVEKGEADIIISFEQLEAARYVSYLKKGGHIITSTQQIDPMPVITGAAVYPEDIIGKLKAEGVDVIALTHWHLRSRLVLQRLQTLFSWALCQLKWLLTRTFGRRLLKTVFLQSSLN